MEEEGTEREKREEETEEIRVPPRTMAENWWREKAARRWIYDGNSWE